MNIKKKVSGLVIIATASLGLGTHVLADSIYTVKSGDTLSQISYDYLGSAEEYKAIATANDIVDANLIFVGQKLNLSADGRITEATAEDIASQPEVATVEEAVVEEAATEVAATPPATEVDSAPAGRQVTVEATAYDGVSLGGVTATGNIIQSTDHKVIAVDPAVIPLGSTVYVPGYGTAIAWDTGGAIQGNIIDLNMATADAIQWGRQTITITIL